MEIRDGAVITITGGADTTQPAPLHQNRAARRAVEKRARKAAVHPSRPATQKAGR